VPYNPIVDQNTLASVDIDYNHHEIHEGDHFYYSNYITLANVAVGNYVLEVGEKAVHFVFAVSSDIAGFTVETYEGITASADGTVIEIFNNNRTLAEDMPSSSVLRYNPVTIGSITGLKKLRNAKVGVGGTPSSRVAGSLQRSDEVILKKNTKYLLRITNLSTSNNDINIGMSWYEHEPK
jgi:hypothetical protein